MLIKLVSICQMAMTKMNIVSKQSNDVHVKNTQMHNQNHNHYSMNLFYHLDDIDLEHPSKSVYKKMYNDSTQLHIALVD